jgi:hypothetical protein
MMEVDLPGWHQLGINVVVQAFVDLRDTDPLRALDALLWLIGDASLWLEGLGMDNDPVILLTSGKVKEVKFGKKQRA